MGSAISDWFFSLPVVPWMAVVVFAAIYLIAASIFWIVTRLAVDDRARAFKAISPGMLSPLGIIFALLLVFIANPVWSNFDQAKRAVATETGALRGIVIIARGLPAEQENRLRTFISEHVNEAVNVDWPAMAKGRATLANNSIPTFIKAMEFTRSLKPQDEAQQMAQREILTDWEQVRNARRDRFLISQAEVSSIKLAALLLIALCVLTATALVHSDNRITCGLALGIFATAMAMSMLLIAAYNKPFTGDYSIGPQLLEEVLPSVPCNCQT